MNREIDYHFWLNATLAAIPISLAVLAAVLTVAGFIGYRRLRGEAVRMARDEAKQAVDALVKSGGLRSMVDESVKREGDLVYEDLRITEPQAKGGVTAQLTVEAAGATRRSEEGAQS